LLVSAVVVGMMVAAVAQERELMAMAVAAEMW
jgi:hypothetical protein